MSERFRFGIATRQMVAFICVGVLVLAANFIVEQGVLIEKTTEITRLLRPDFAPKRPTSADQRNASILEALTLALEHFRRAAEERVGTNTSETETGYQSSAAELDRASRTFFTQVASSSGKSFSSFISSVRTYKSNGDDLVLMADSRNAMIVEYATLFEAVYARANRSVNGAWRVFGRIVARQSLLQLRADLDELRRRSAAVGSVYSADAPEIEPLLKAERTVSDDLHVNERGLRRAEGVPWFTAMRDDLAQLIALRESLLQANSQLQLRLQEFTEKAASISALIPSKIEMSPAAPASITQGWVAEHAVELAPSVVSTQSVTTHPLEDHRKRTWIAWISVAVLLTVSSIAVGTVLSIVRPVRRLIDASTRLASGESGVHVRRGGIRELDTLAVAFNRMAEELSEAKSAARDYQQSLEAQVLERTHQLQELAVRDPLTGMPNRRQFFPLLNAAIDRSANDQCLVGLYFLDVDNFKYLNDSMGHAFGDRVLVSLARRLDAATRGFGFAARLGGDEFTMVLERAESIGDIELIGLSVVKAFQQPLSVDGRDLMVSVSVGASVYPDHAQGAEALLTAADLALFRAKELGRGRLSMFTPDLLRAAAAKFETEQALRSAIERREFELVFQPEVSTEVLETVLVEALIRWRTPQGSLITADRFLAVAEESGLILEIGDWVLRSAIEAASHWYHGAWPAVCVAINVSPRQLVDNGFVGRVCELLQQYRLPPHCIEIELTESVLQTGAATIRALRSLRAHGVAIALDDFGTGYSSFSSLEQLPLTRVKLDRSLIAGIDTNPRSAAITHAIAAMCHGLGLHITAEGVERPQQFTRLLGQPGMYLQGYLLGPPVPEHEVLGAMAAAESRAQELLLAKQTANSADAVGLSVVSLLEVPATG